MRYARQWMRRFGMKPRHQDGLDTFDLRLQRIGSREARVIDRKVLFRPLLPALEA